MSADWKQRAAKELDDREAALIERHAFLNRQLQAVLNELRDIGAARRTLGLEAHGEAEERRAGKRLFKDVALEKLREAYPKPMKASEIRAAVEKELGKTFHPKTAGMSLFRLASREGGGLVRREGHKWYFVPKE